MAFDFARRKKRLGDLLVQEGVITEEALNTALKEQKKRGTRLGETLIDLDYVKDEDIVKTLQNQLGLESVDLVKMRIEESIIALLNDAVVRKFTLIPIGFHKNNPNVLVVAMADPMDIGAIDEVSIITNLQIEPVIATTRSIKVAIDKYYGKDAALAVVERYTKERGQTEENNEVDAQYEEEINNSPIVQLVKSIIEQAVRQRASDIHIEPFENEVRIRFRVDGMLIVNGVYVESLISAIVARIKIMADLDISEKRKPQDGRFTVTVDRKEYDVRVSMLPTIFGEKIVMRLISKKGLTRSKSKLGFNQRELERFDNILKNPNGIILVTGPTGSGKSTTLYTALSELNKPDVNIITVEDPVEANINGIVQVQVNNKANLTFASTLRSILRQDPDIIMIGEIRDAETAQIAIKASITGHLVVSTLHTNSAASSITRLVDMGIEPYFLADAMVGIIAQRLVRKLCECKKTRKVHDYEKPMLGLTPEEDVIICDTVGCDLCGGSGYLGRTGIYEIMPITPKIKTLINQKATSDEINDLAIREGMVTLRKAAVEYVLKGVISVEEVMRITFE